jgi:lipopolysaccharide heptosyltransferase II
VPPPRILLVRFSSIGDVLLTTPLIRALRRACPDATITALTKRQFAPLLADNPHLDATLALGPEDSLPALGRSIRQQRFTHLLDLHGNLRSRILRLLAPGPWQSYNPRRRARRELIRFKRDRYPDRVPVAERYFEAARDLGVTPDGGPPEFAVSTERDAEAGGWLGPMVPERGHVALAPGAHHATKRWPAAHWEALAARLASHGYGVVVVGGLQDATLSQAVARAAGAAGRSATGQFDLPGSAALLARARVLVSGDTGLMHLATAVGTPVVALFGPTVEQFGFFPYRATAVVLQRDLPCRPCSAMGGTRCPLGHHRCLTEITPEEVAARVMELAP